MATTGFNIFDHLNKLEIVKETSTEYHCTCPLCGDGGFKLNKKNGKYYTHKCGCMETAEGKKAVIQALAPAPVEPTQKSIRPKQIRTWIYRERNGQPLVRV